MADLITGFLRGIALLIFIALLLATWYTQSYFPLGLAMLVLLVFGLDERT